MARILRKVATRQKIDDSSRMINNERSGLLRNRQITLPSPTAHILVLTTYDADAGILRAVEAGATG